MTKKSKILLNELIHDLSSDDYHGYPNSVSSTKLKDILDDEEVYFRKHVEKSVPREESPAFDVGTYFHTAILEPHKLKFEAVVFPGKIRRGKDWEIFKKKHAGKAIITPNEREVADSIVDAVRNSPIAMSYIHRGEPEVSLFVELRVVDGDIFCHGGTHIMTRDGWRWHKPLTHTRGTTLICKVRADSLGSDFVLDLKSTTGNTKSEFLIKNTVGKYSYDLSAAFYLDMFTAGTRRIENPYRNFFWVFASKDYRNCKTYLASADMVKVGRAKWMKAIQRIARMTEKEWQFEDSLGYIEPNVWDLELIREKDEDFL